MKSKFNVSVLMCAIGLVAFSPTESIAQNDAAKLVTYAPFAGTKVEVNFNGKPSTDPQWNWYHRAVAGAVLKSFLKKTDLSAELRQKPSLTACCVAFNIASNKVERVRILKSCGSARLDERLKASVEALNADKLLKNLVLASTNVHLSEQLILTPNVVQKNSELLKTELNPIPLKKLYQSVPPLSENKRTESFTLRSQT